MTERHAAHVRRSADTLQIGPSVLDWKDGVLVLRIDEIAAPWPARIRGTIRLRSMNFAPRQFALDARGAHRWYPLSPVSEVEVEFEQPRISWCGNAYLDANAGDEPLEQGFVDWSWARAAVGEDTAVIYDVCRRDASAQSMAKRFHRDGSVSNFIPPPLARLPTTGWGISRAIRADAGRPPVVRQTFENAPFYARSLVASHWDGQPVEAVHESLSLQRFQARWVQALLPFRMPRPSLLSFVTRR